VLEVRGRPDLRKEALRADHRGELGLQNLQSDLAVVPQVVRQVNGRHAAGPERALDAVSTLEGPREALDIVGCRHGATTCIDARTPDRRRPGRTGRDGGPAQSAFRTSTGSTAVARSAGRRQAAAATPLRTSATPT